jgi:transcriptional regulator with XRE-family HTH domain
VSVERGLSQEALAHERGINRTYLSNVERSERNVSIDNIARIAGTRRGPFFRTGLPRAFFVSARAGGVLCKEECRWNAW